MRKPTMTKVKITFHDDGPDKDNYRRYTLDWWSTSQKRQRAQVFDSADWRKHQQWAIQGHNGSEE